MNEQLYLIISQLWYSNAIVTDNAHNFYTAHQNYLTQALIEFIYTLLLTYFMNKINSLNNENLLNSQFYLNFINNWQWELEKGFNC